MRVAQALLIAAMVFVLTGCPLRKPPAVKAAPPAPKAAPAPAPPPPPEPLSVPQTNVQLAPPQPLSPEAIASTQLPGETPPPAPPAPRANGRGASRPPQRATTEPSPPTPTMPAAIQPPPVETEIRPPVTEVLSPGEQKRLQEDAAARSQEAQRIVEQLPAARRNQQRNTVARVETFLKQAREAEARGDMRQASELAGRALVLARELRP